ncbi:hypothetical protein GOL40_28035 [Sinorhizobium medicae]|nr:hypothetical protein [Sinorhizobium medicae]
MLMVGVKIALGVCAFVVAVIAALEYPLTFNDAAGAKRPYWKRLTPAGKANLVCAIAAFALVVVSEIADYREDEARTASADTQNKAINEQLAKAEANLGDAKMAIGRTLIDLASLKRENSYLVRTLDKSMFRAGVARLTIEDSSGTGDHVLFAGGKEIIPKARDEVEWKFVCRDSLPVLADVTDSMCRQIAYGRLMANGDQIVLGSPEGRRVLFGTRSTGGVLEYRNPSEDYSCADLTRRMEAASCELQLAIWREGRWEFEELKELDQADTPSIETQDACRKYEALFGETCDQAVERLQNR